MAEHPPLQQPASQQSQQSQQPPHPAAQSQPNEPQRHHVHHSYIWLGSIHMLATILVVAILSSFSGIVGAISKGEQLSSSDMPVLFIIILVVAVGLLLIAGLTVLFYWLSYRHLYYELGPSEFNLYSGIFNKKRVHVPYQRIQSVDQRASLLQRIFGVCTVSIDTAGGAANKAVVVPYLQKAQAEELRRALFTRKQYVVALQNGTLSEAEAQAAAQYGLVSAPGASMSVASIPQVPAGVPQPGVPAAQTPHNVLDAPAELWQDVRGVFAGASVDTGRVTYEYGMSNKELVFTGLSNNTAFIVVILGIVGAVGQFASEVAPLIMGVAEPVVGNVVATGARLFGGNLIAAGVAAFLLAAVVLWVISAVGTCISYGGFRACRRDQRIEVEHGLLQHQFQGVDVDRVQSVVVKQSFIRRLLGYCELSLGKIDAASENSNEQQKNLNANGLIIHPFVKLTRVPEILAGIIPEFADVPAQTLPVAPVGLRRALVRRCIIQGTGFWLAICLAIAQIVLNVVLDTGNPSDIAMLTYVNTGALVGYAVCVALLVLDAIGAVLWFRGSGFAFNDRFMQVSNGGFARETISFPRKKIQFGYTKTNPFQRNAHTATVNARTAAGIGGTTIRLIDATEHDAEAWLAWLEPHARPSRPAASALVEPAPVAAVAPEASASTAGEPPQQ